MAYVTEAIVNPRNLKIEGFYCMDSISGQELILLAQDIRELSKQGYIVDDHDVLAEAADLVRLKDVLEMHFDLIKKPVVTISKKQVGKVNDYAVETSSLYIQKLYVAQSFWKSLTGGALSVDRSQINEVTSKRIVINDPLQPTTSSATAAIA